MTRQRTFTPEQMATRNDRAKAWYAANRETVLARLRNRPPEERVRISEYKRQRYATNPTVREQAKSAAARWRLVPENKLKEDEYQRRYQQSDQGQATKRRDRLMRYFQMTVEQYDAMLEKQEGVCAICRQPETKMDSRSASRVQALSVDHDHRCCPGKTSCGECVRGLLCDRCNLGRWPDEPALLRAAADYFERYRKETHGGQEK